MSKILLIDNYDSFTYNLYHYLEELNEGGVEVMRNNEINFDRLELFSKVVISPGPGLPGQAGDLLQFLERFSHQKQILGICLGQQAIATHFGMRLKNLSEVVHGQSKKIKIVGDQSVLYKGLPKEIKVGRYHSWVIEPESLNENFEVTAVDEVGNIMSIKHKNLPIYAVQFHPESILTDYGKEMIKNWLENT